MLPKQDEFNSVNSTTDNSLWDSTLKEEKKEGRWKYGTNLTRS